MVMDATRFRRANYIFSPQSIPDAQQPATGAPVNVSVNPSAAKQGFVDLTQGRISLAALEIIIIGMLIFYWRTRGIQGGG